MTQLLVPREEAGEKLLERLELGERLRLREIRSREQLRLAEAERDRWDAYNADLLRSISDAEAIVAEYIESAPENIEAHSFPDQVEAFRRIVGSKINKLRSITERLELMSPFERQRKVDLSSVFLVHGHDEVRDSVARFLEKIGLRVIILEEQASQGRTIIEQFEQHAAVGFAVILLTPDDLGASARAVENLKPRARQNVIFELGYFCGSLGRHRVSALYKGEVELPSDMHGVVYVTLDSGGGWRLRLFRELQAAKMNVSPVNLL